MSYSDTFCDDELAYESWHQERAEMLFDLQREEKLAAQYEAQHERP